MVRDDYAPAIGIIFFYKACLCLHALIPLSTIPSDRRIWRHRGTRCYSVHLATGLLRRLLGSRLLSLSGTRTVEFTEGLNTRPSAAVSFAGSQIRRAVLIWLNPQSSPSNVMPPYIELS